jgi:hypothetical protein
MSVRGSPARRLYDIWSRMKNRCENPKYFRYFDYGGRGITVCDEWHDSEKFFSWALAHGYGPKLTIERIDNNKGYGPDNCCWATYKEQNRNKRNVVILELDGERKTISEWAEHVEMSYGALWYRLRSGWELIDALAVPVMESC